MEKILCEIENLRLEMHQTITLKQMSHPDVLRASQRLDQAINELFAWTLA